MKQVQPKKEPRFIRIKAESSIYSVTEDVPESRVVSRLINIRSNFVSLSAKYYKRFDKENKLKVSTHVLNPELNFRR